ncbi:MAG TPA: BatD family protein [Puia sp.]|nr:BatD family protein [Puia sp.]
MRRNFLHIALILALLAESPFLFSQNIPNVKASVDRNEIILGQPLELVLEVNSPVGSNTGWFALDSIPHFNFIEKGKIDSVETGGGKSYRQRLVITSFDSGRVMIPALPATIDNQKYYTDSIPVEVSFSKFDPNQDYHDIKDILDIQNPYVKYIIWILLALTLIAAALFLYFVQKKKVLVFSRTEPELPSLSPFEEAIKSLEELRKQRLPEMGQTKLFYTRLNDILRLFVMRKLHIASMEKTNEELILQLRQQNISRDQFSQLTASLRMSDFVKFAKYLPDKNDNDQNFGIIESSIQLLNQIEK